MSGKKLQYVFVVALIVLVSIGYLSYPLLGPDSGFYLATAREIYHGKTYFVDIVIAYNPLAIVLLGLPFLFDAHPDPRFSLLINMLFVWVSAYLLYRILQKINPHNKQNSFYALFFVLGCLMLDGSHLMLEPISVFFQLAGLLLYLNIKDSGKNYYLVFAGSAFALSFLSKQYGLFILAPVGIDLLLNRNQILKKTSLLALGFAFPLILFYLYLANNGMGLEDFFRHIMGVGTKLEIGNGTGINYNLTTYLIGFGVFVAFNLYVLLLPGWWFKIRKQLELKNAIYFLVLPFSLLVLVSASYAHYFIYVLPYALMAFVFLSGHNQQKNRFQPILLFLSICLMGCVALFSLSRKQDKITLQEETFSKLAAEIPQKSKVYLDGISPAFYYLCDFQSIKLNQLGFTFPGYFYQKTIVNAMDSGAYLVVSQDAYPSYRQLTVSFEKKDLTINGQLFHILKKK